MLKSEAMMAVTFFGAVASIAWSATVSWIYWLKHRFDEPVSRPEQSVDAERIARLEMAVDAIAIEIERLGESQRFSNKLLSERLPQRPASGSLPSPASGRVITPH